MKVNEIEINGKVYRACYSDKNHNNICNKCDLKSQCDTDINEIIREICSHNFACNFKEVKQKENAIDKFYKFSSGTVFNIDHINRIITIGEIKHYEDGDYSFTISTIDWTVSIVNKSKLILTRERNKFIKFIEEYGY